MICLAACDTGSPPAVQSKLTEAVSFDESVAERAAALDQDLPQVPLAARYSSADRPLYTFASQAEYEQAAEALARLAKQGGQPLDIHERFRSLDLTDAFAPGSEIALLDEHGQVVIDGARVTLRVQNGEPVSEITDAATEVSRETLRSTFVSLDEARAMIGSGTIRSPQIQGRISQNAEDKFGVFPSLFGQRTVPGTPFRVNDAFGRSWDLWFVYAHSAYSTYTGARRVKGATEAVIAGPGIPFTSAITAQKSQFPGLHVYAKVLTEDHGCRPYFDDSRFTSGFNIEVEIGGSRGLGQGVIESEHRQVAPTSGFNYGFSETLDGENDRWIARCGGTPNPR